MNQFTSIHQRLTDRIRRIETEIAALRRELKTLPEPSQPLPVDVTVSQNFVSKTALKEQMQRLFLTLAIQGEPIGAEKLQKQMREAKLTSNELSQSIIASREE
jgi:hypothetical protein